MSDSEYSVIKSDVIKRFDCMTNPFNPTELEKTRKFVLSPANVISLHNTYLSTLSSFLLFSLCSSSSANFKAASRI